jgi:hypothetical protein
MELLHSYAQTLCQALDLEENENVRVIFTLIDRTGNVKTKTTLVIAKHDARTVHFMMTEATDFVMDNLGRLLKSGKAKIHNLATRGRTSRDYPRTTLGGDGVPMYDWLRIHVTHCIAISTTACGLMEGFFALIFHGSGVGLNDKKESVTSARSDNTTLAGEPRGFYFAATVRKHHRNYPRFDKEWRAHYLWRKQREEAGCSQTI